VSLNLHALVAVIAICVTAIIVALIWRTTKHKYR
jgi:hypothetical protein